MNDGGNKLEQAFDKAAERLGVQSTLEGQAYLRGYDAGRKAEADDKIIGLLERFICMLDKKLSEHQHQLRSEITALREQLRTWGTPTNPEMAVEPILTERHTYPPAAYDPTRYESVLAQVDMDGCKPIQIPHPTMYQISLAQARQLGKGLAEKTGRQANYIVVDDPVASREAAGTPEETEKMAAWAGRLGVPRGIITGRPSFAEEANRHAAACNARAENGVVEESPAEALPPRPATLFEPALKENWQIPDDEPAPDPIAADVEKALMMEFFKKD